MLLISDFVRDLARLRRYGLLPTALRVLFVRSELLVWLAAVGAIVYYCYSEDSAKCWSLTIVFVLLLLHFLFVSFVVKWLTPLYFGKPAFARLDRIEHWAKPGPLTAMRFSVLPAAVPLGINIMGIWPVRGTVGTVYLLLYHPANASIALPVIDDDPTFLSYLLALPTPDRRAYLLSELRRLRGAVD
jgi:hypothetical protein